MRLLTSLALSAGQGVQFSAAAVLQHVQGERGITGTHWACPQVACLLEDCGGDAGALGTGAEVWACVYSVSVPSTLLCSQPRAQWLPARRLGSVDAREHTADTMQLSGGPRAGGEEAMSVALGGALAPLPVPE